MANLETSYADDLWYRSGDGGRVGGNSHGVKKQEASL